MAANVTQFTASDFSRTLTSNSSLGTDHGWGNNHIVLGGSVVGQRIYGTYPTLVVGGPNDTMIELWRGACLRAGGIDLETVEDIEQVLWNKFVTVSAFSGASSLMRASLGPILGDPESRVFLEQLRDEGVAVASAALMRVR